MSKSEVRTRFAPSPTGMIHVGGLRTALFAWAYARNQNGKFVLRIEDTDKSREVEGSIKHIEASLKWLGIDWDEGPIKQSDRLEIYREWAQKLVDKGLAYTEPYSEEELQAYRQKAKDAHAPFLYRNIRPNGVSADTDWYGKRALRFMIPQIKSYSWHDEVRGELSAGEGALDDFIIIKADGYPTYNFAHVIDDHLMNISHVMRGEEFIPSMPKFLALHDALEIEYPKFATMPPILAKSGGKKLSKRDGAKDVLDYRQEQYLADAVLNFIASLGWNDGTEQEIYTPHEIVTKFSLDRIQRSGARFDEDKLNWINWQHYQKLLEENAPRALEHIGLGDVNEQLESAAKLSATKAASIDDFKSQLKIFNDYDAFALNQENLQQVDDSLDVETAERYLSEAKMVLSGLDSFDVQSIEKALRDKMEELDAKPRAFLNLIRWKVSGQRVSPNLFEMIEVLGKDTTIERLSL